MWKQEFQIIQVSQFSAAQGLFVPASTLNSSWLAETSSLDQHNELESGKVSSELESER